MRKSGLTEKRLANKHYSKIENAMLRVFFRRKRRMNPRRMAAEIGVARGTIYNHHQVAEFIIQDYENYIYERYSKEVSKFFRRRNVTISGLYRRTLIFIMRERKIFGILIKAKDKEVFERMIRRLKKYNRELDGLNGNVSDIYNIYSGEIAEILFLWGKGGFKKEKMSEVLDDIVQMTTTMRINLTKLNLYRDGLNC